MKPINIKLLTAILIPMLLLTLAGFGYAHWTDSVTKQIKLHAGYVKASIISYKCLSEFDDDWIIKDPPEDEVPEEGFSTLRIWTDRAFPGWYVWIGLLIQNQGPFPVWVDVPEYKVTMTPPSYVATSIKEYFYGPYRLEEFNDAGVWGEIGGGNYEEKLDPDQGVIGVDPEDPPVYLEPVGGQNENKLVLWIYLEIVDGSEDFVAEIEITLRTVLALP